MTIDHVVEMSYYLTEESPQVVGTAWINDKAKPVVNKCPVKKSIDQIAK